MCSFHKIFISTQFTPIEIIYKKYIPKERQLLHTQKIRKGEIIFLHLANREWLVLDWLFKNIHAHQIYLQVYTTYTYNIFI